jgi:hypothetical protein
VTGIAPAPGRRVFVIGAGASGTAAAFAAKGAGADVTVVVGRTGATSLTSGALDGEPGDLASSQPLSELARAIGIWELWGGLDVGPGFRVATSAGILRPTLGRDINVLDLGEVGPGVVAVASAPRRGWDPVALAKGWTNEPWARSRGVRFEPVELDVLRVAGERTLPDPDLARRHDDPERAGWLLDRLKASAAVRRATGVLFGPWLGIRRPLARELARSLGKPVGELLSVPGGPAGIRFERARDDLLVRHRIARIEGEVRRVERVGETIELDCHDGSSHRAEIVVLATGGLVGGGIGWSGGDARLWFEQAAPACAGFVGPARTPAALAVGRAPPQMSGSPQGPLFEAHAWSGGLAPAGMETVGLWTASDGRARGVDGAAIPWLFCAGDAVAGAPRTMLHAIRSGLAAGLAAARSATAETPMGP